MAEGSVLVVGGTAGLGRAIASHYHEQGKPVIITGRDQKRAEEIAAEIGDGVAGLGFDLAKPETIGDALSEVGPVLHLVVTAIVRDNNPIREYDISTASELITMKMIGYTKTVHALIPKFTEDASVVLYGGLAKERPYPGAITVATVNGGISTMINDLVDRVPGRDIEVAGEDLFGNRHADGVGKPLAERTRGGFDPRRVAVLRMARRHRAQLAEVLEFRHWQRVAGQVQQRVDQHRTVAIGQDEAVAVGPVRIPGIVLQVSGPEDLGDIGHAHRRAGMTRVRLLHRIH